MKRNLIILVLLIVLLLLNAGAGYFIYKQSQTISRLESNQATFHTGDHTNTVRLTKEELKELYRDQLDTILNKLEIRFRNVDHYIRTDYRLIDTMVTSYFTSSSDSVKEVRFLIQKPCYELSGTVYPDSITTHLNLKDKITTLLYWQRKKGFAGVRWFWMKKQYKCYQVSGCSGDTLGIIDNVEIVKE